MGLRFRKSVSLVPGVRINISRRGFSTTIGGRGASINLGAHGTYLNTSLPGTGISFRTRLNSPDSPGRRTKNTSKYNEGPLPTDPFLIQGTKVDFGSSDVSALTSAGLESLKELVIETKDRKNEIILETKAAKRQLLFEHIKLFLVTILIFGFIGNIRDKIKKKIREYQADIENLKVNLSNTKVVIDFDMETELSSPFNRMQKAFDEIIPSQAKWSVVSSQRIDRVKARSSAGSVVGRQPVKLWRGGDALIETNSTPCALGALKKENTIYFYPGFLLISSDKDFAVVDFTEIEFNASTTKFHESSGFPKDGEIVGYTWAKANKDGSRDKRFSANKQIPILKYGEFYFRNSSGLNEAYMMSRSQPCLEFIQTVNDLRRILTSSATRKMSGASG